MDLPLAQTLSRGNYDILNTALPRLCLSFAFLLQRGKMKVGEDARMRFKGSVYIKTHCLVVNKKSTGPVALTTPAPQTPVRLEAL